MSPELKVAIIGAGPAGLGAAIEFEKLPFIDYQIYEQASELREIGAGISLQRNTWRMLDVLGALENISPNEMFRAVDHHSVQHRNGRTGELLVSHDQRDTPPRHRHARALRSVLQKGLLKSVNQSKLRLQSRLFKIVETSSGTLSLSFEDGHTDEVDLLVGADGIRSVVRKFIFPDHRLKYTGMTGYRGLAPANEIFSIPNFPNAVTFWHGLKSHLYTCNLNNNVYEVSARVAEAEDDVAAVSWGQDAKIEDFKDRFVEYSPIVRAAIDKMTEVRKFALFSGPRLPRIISHGSIALIGDASHPLSGAFGDGAGFALEDVFVLTRAVKWAHERSLSLGDALELFDSIRAPHYEAIYDILAEAGKADAAFKGPQTFDNVVAHGVAHKWTGDSHWLYHYDVQEVWKKASQAEDARRAGNLDHVKESEVTPRL